MDVFTDILDVASGPVPGNVRLVVMMLVLSFVLGNLIAWTYMLTHSGLSYSRSFVQSLVVLPIILSMLLHVLMTMVDRVSTGRGMGVAFGLLGIAAIVRFRNILKDTRDTAFLLLTLAVGVGAGTKAYGASVIGAVAVCAVLVVLHYTSFGSRHRFDVILSFRLASGARGLPAVEPIFYRHCRRIVLASQRASEAADAGDFSYRLLLRNPDRSTDLVEELGELEGVSRISIIQRDDESEV